VLFAGIATPHARRRQAYDVREFIDDPRDLNVTPHIAPDLGDRRLNDTA
jgi:hypothetical protein